MTAPLAHLRLFGRHHRTVVIGGLHWRYCHHRSHRAGLPCWRWRIYDGQCPRHNSSCYHACPQED